MNNINSKKLKETLDNKEAISVCGLPEHQAEQNIIAKDVAEILKNISNSVRLVLLCNLLDGKKNVSELVEKCGVSQSALSQHLALLREVGIISANKDKKFVYYSIKDDKVREILGFLKGICKN